MKNYFKRALNGKEKLWKVFWLQNILGCFVLSTVGSFIFVLCFLEPSLFLSNNPITILAILKTVPLLIMGFVFTGFVLWYGIVAIISLWKCSWNSSNRIWGYAARGVLFASLALTVLEQVFGG